jgi:hypothetical protein
MQIQFNLNLLGCGEWLLHGARHDERLLLLRQDGRPATARKVLNRNMLTATIDPAVYSADITMQMHSDLRDREFQSKEHKDCVALEERQVVLLRFLLE